MIAVTGICVGVVADTPRTISPALAEALAGATRIVHAGGIASVRALDELRAIAPVEAVTSHEDFISFGDRLPESAEFEVAGVRFFVTNLVGTPPDFLPPVRTRLADSPPDVVIFGHPTTPQMLWIGGTLFLNPGSVKGLVEGVRPTFAIVEIAPGGRITGHVHDL